MAKEGKGKERKRRLLSGLLSSLLFFSYPSGSREKKKGAFVACI